MKYSWFICPKCFKHRVKAKEQSQPICKCGAKMVKDEPEKRIKEVKLPKDFGKLLL